MDSACYIVLLYRCVIFRLLTQTGGRLPPGLAHAASLLSGTLLAAHFFGTGVFYLLVLVTLAWALLAVSQQVC